MTQSHALCLHVALADALNPEAPITDYDALRLCPDDGGYLRSLVETCRDCFRALPSSHQVAPLLLREARRISVQAVNHCPDHTVRGVALLEWVRREYPGSHEASWFEIAAAAGANLSIYALFALAAEPNCSTTDIDTVYNAYFPWMGALATMLDSFVDQEEDKRCGEHRYVSYYGSESHAGQHIAHLVRRCLLETQALDNSERHRLVTAAMVAMYLSRDSARAPALKCGSREIERAGGSLTRALLPALRLWRIANNSSAT